MVFGGGGRGPVVTPRRINGIETVDQPEGVEASSNYVLPDPAVGRNQRLDLWIVTRQQAQKKREIQSEIDR